MLEEDASKTYVMTAQSHTVILRTASIYCSQNPNRFLLSLLDGKAPILFAAPSILVYDSY